MNNATEGHAHQALRGPLQARRGQEGKAEGGREREGRAEEEADAGARRPVLFDWVRHRGVLRALALPLL
eukprot:5133311-Alexandrium_andersonii.AAC.1